MAVFLECYDPLNPGPKSRHKVIGYKGLNITLSQRRSEGERTVDTKAAVAYDWGLYYRMSSLQ
jgi:hypothetical protein